MVPAEQVQARQYALPQPQQPAIPALEHDPVGNIIGRLNRQDQIQNQYVQQAQASMILGALTQRAQAYEQAFMRQNPDYPQAVAFLQRSRHEELERAGVRDPNERAQMIQQDGLGVAVRMLQSGGDPAAAIYNIAKGRGYEARVLEPPAPQPRPAQSSAAQRRLETISAGQQHARSLGSARGTAPRAAMTAERALGLSDRDYDKLLQTPEGLALLGS